MNRRMSLLAGLGGCALSLLGCASLPPPSNTPNHWAGRLVLLIQDTPVHRHSAAFELTGTITEGELNLFNPLGSTVAQARWSPNQAQLQQGQQVAAYNDMADLLQAATGAALPLAAVFDWLQGQATDPPGWQVDLSQHSQGRIRAQRVSPAPAISLLIVIHQP